MHPACSQTYLQLKKRPVNRAYKKDCWSVEEDRLLLAAHWRGVPQAKIEIPGKSKSASRHQLMSLKHYLSNDLYNAHKLLPAPKELGVEALCFGLTYHNSPIVKAALAQYSGSGTEKPTGKPAETPKERAKERLQEVHASVSRPTHLNHRHYPCTSGSSSPQMPRKGNWTIAEDAAIIEHYWNAGALPAVLIFPAATIPATTLTLPSPPPPSPPLSHPTILTAFTPIASAPPSPSPSALSTVAIFANSLSITFSSTVATTAHLPLSSHRRSCTSNQTQGAQHPSEDPKCNPVPRPSTTKLHRWFHRVQGQARSCRRLKTQPDQPPMCHGAEAKECRAPASMAP